MDLPINMSTIMCDSPASHPVCIPFSVQTEPKFEEISQPPGKKQKSLGEG